MHCDGIQNIEYFVKSGKIYDQITELADSVNANLIIMGTEGTPKEIVVDENVIEAYLGGK